ncbi:MAG: hypothetical protein QXR60_02335 [Candidatus Nanoarchaeia archaeon]
MKFDGLSLNRWVIAIVAIITGLLILIVSSFSVVFFVWKAVSMIKSFGVSAVSTLVTGSVIIAILGYMLFSLGARLFMYSSLIQKTINSLEAQEVVNRVFRG